MVRSANIFICSLTLAVSLSCLYVYKHNEVLAARQAEKVARVLLVERDFEAGFEIQKVERTDSLSAQALEKFVNEMHKSGLFPKEIKAVEFEPMFGQEGMRIYLEGKNEENIFRYEFVMTGTEPKGYTVFAMYRFEGEFPQSSLRQRLP